MAQRKRKSRQRNRPGASAARSTATPTQPPAHKPAVQPSRPAAARRGDSDWVQQYAARAEAKNAEARARLVPLERGEYPWPLTVSIVIATVLALGTLALLLARVKVDGKPPANSWILYVVVMLACAYGMYRHWYQAVLAFMCLLGIAIVVFAALLLRFSNLLGLLIPLAVILGGGTLFWKLVRVLGRLQMPERPQRAVER